VSSAASSPSVCRRNGTNPETANIVEEAPAGEPHTDQEATQTGVTAVVRPASEQPNPAVNSDATTTNLLETVPTEIGVHDEKADVCADAPAEMAPMSRPPANPISMIKPSAKNKKRQGPNRRNRRKR